MIIEYVLQVVKDTQGDLKNGDIDTVVLYISAGSLISNGPFTIDSLSKNSSQQFSHSLLP